MVRRLYVVELQDRHWYVRVGTLRHGPFLTRANAVESAIQAASQRNSAEVLVRSPQGGLETVWTKPPHDAKV